MKIIRLFESGPTTRKINLSWWFLSLRFTIFFIFRKKHIKEHLNRRKVENRLTYFPFTPKVWWRKYLFIWLFAEDQRRSIPVPCSSVHEEQESFHCYILYIIHTSHNKWSDPRNAPFRTDRFLSFRDSEYVETIFKLHRDSKYIETIFNLHLLAFKLFSWRNCAITTGLPKSNNYPTAKPLPPFSENEPSVTHGVVVENYEFRNDSKIQGLPNCWLLDRNRESRDRIRKWKCSDSLAV